MDLNIVILIMFTLNVLSSYGDVKVTKYTGTCKEYPHPKAYYISKFFDRNGDTFVKQTLNVTEEFSSLGKMTIIPQRCPSRENLNYCENLRNVTIAHFGLLIDNPNNAWTKEFASYTPPLGKPVKTGLYNTGEKKIDSNWAIIKSKGYWRVKAILMEEGTNDVVLCVSVEGEVR